MTAGTCSVAGCELPRHTRGMCKTHSRGGRTLAERIAPCAQDGCEQLAYARGFCERHYRRMLRAEKGSQSATTKGRKAKRAKAAPPPTPDLPPYVPGTLEHTSEWQGETKAIANGLQTIAPVAPLPAETCARARDTLIALGGADLLDMLGLTA